MKEINVYIRRSNIPADENIVVWTKIKKNDYLGLENFLTTFGILASIEDMHATMKITGGSSHFFIDEENYWYNKDPDLGK